MFLSCDMFMWTRYQKMSHITPVNSFFVRGDLLSNNDNTEGLQISSEQTSCLLCHLKYNTFNSYIRICLGFLKCHSATTLQLSSCCKSTIQYINLAMWVYVLG